MDGQRFNFLEAGLWKDFIFNCNVYLGSAPKSSLGTESQYGWKPCACSVSGIPSVFFGWQSAWGFRKVGFKIFLFWEQLRKSCFQVKSEYLNTKTQFWQAVEIWIVSECASRGKNCEVAPPELSQSSWRTFPTQFGIKMQRFCLMTFWETFSGHPVPLPCSTLFTVKKVVGVWVINLLRLDQVNHVKSAFSSW